MLLRGALFALFFLLKSTTAMDAKRCGDGGWKHDPNTGKCYLFLNEKFTWEEAREQCSGRDSHLASIHSVQENSFIQSISGGEIWIGLTDLVKDGFYFWSDRSALDYANWDTSKFQESGRHNGNESCVEMWTHSALKIDELTILEPLGTWNKEDCAAKNYAVCERIDTFPLLPDDICNLPTPTCSSTNRFYSIDGSCNNLEHPFWGSTNQPFQRLVPAQYEANFAPRGSPDILPNPRLVSTTLHSNDDNPDNSLTHIVAPFGQFVDHDISLTPEAHEECCHLEGQTIPENCFPIQIPVNDPFYASLSPPQTCLEFSRSFPYCNEPIREQFNAINAFIDGSNIYGSDEVTANVLRSHVDGKLKASPHNLLPEVLGEITAGDVRVIEQPALASIHTLWMREHNRLADRTKSKNPTFNDEQIYLNTRQLVAAQLQNIIYSEWLPIIIGYQLMDDYSLKVDSQQPHYNKSLNPTVVNSFATAAFRFGHTLIQGRVSLVSSRDGSSAGSFLLRNNFHNTSLIMQEDGMENILKGHTIQSCQRFDQFVTEDLTNFLFPAHGHNFGTDLIARNIQRGRDHGLPGYNKFREFCNLSPITDMTTAPAEFSSEKWTKIASVYTNPDDVDLFSAGILENKLSDGVVGPTFGCIIAEQFKRIKFGDRFFFSHSEQAGSLTTEDFDYVRSRTMRDVLCDNTNIKALKENVFLNDGSSLKYCATA